jgi:hypothetical protein
MNNLPFSPFEWPRLQPGATVRGWFLLALALTIVLTMCLCSIAHCATVNVSGQSCPLSTAYERSDASLVVDGCNTVLICAASGASYSAGAVLSVSGSCSTDRIFRGEFQ